MRVSEHYTLNRQQGELDFIDVDIEGDLPLFVDPRALRRLPTPWGQHCVSLIQDFFSTVLGHIRGGRREAALALLAGLSEPNETHLGLSLGRARGHALGPGYAGALLGALASSEAVRSGLLADLEETILMVEGVNVDLISDMTTNIIRDPLIAYTQDMCRYYGMTLQPGVASGRVWDASTKEWDDTFAELPVTPHGRLLLVPKAIVRRHLEYECDDYYTHFVLEALRQEELDARTELVKLLKNGQARVHKKDVREKYGAGKALITRVTMRRPQLLADYRRAKQESPREPLSLEALSDLEGRPAADWDALISAVAGLRPGHEDADAYVDAIERLFTALFYPSLVYPTKELRIHEGRKRIDLSYTNQATEGFFQWVARHYPAPFIHAECKNYFGDPANPELDQLAGRFSPGRGRVGILVCRTLNDKDLFIARCRDTARDDRGFVVPLDDADLTGLVELRKANNLDSLFQILKERFERLVL